MTVQRITAMYNGCPSRISSYGRFFDRIAGALLALGEKLARLAFATAIKFHLVSRIPQADLDILMRRLEIGLPSEGIELLELPLLLTRGEYLNLLGSGVRNAGESWFAPPDLFSRVLR